MILSQELTIFLGFLDDGVFKDFYLPILLFLHHDKKSLKLIYLFFCYLLDNMGAW